MFGNVCVTKLHDILLLHSARQPIGVFDFSSTSEGFNWLTSNLVIFLKKLVEAIVISLIRIKDFILIIGKYFLLTNNFIVRIQKT